MVETWSHVQCSYNTNYTMYGLVWPDPIFAQGVNAYNIRSHVNRV